MAKNVELVACMTCGKMVDIDLLDAKPQPGADPETADFDLLECKECYGPGWVPAIMDAEDRGEVKFINPGGKWEAPGQI